MIGREGNGAPGLGKVARVRKSGNKFLVRCVGGGEEVEKSLGVICD